MVSRPAAIVLGLIADRMLGDPPDAAHPVAWFGNLMHRLERLTYRDSRAAGLVHAATGLAVAAAAARVCRSTTLATAICVAQRGLTGAAERIAGLLDAADLEGARAALPNLVGRDPTGLDEQEIVRAVIESVAENTVDAVIAPIMWAAVAGPEGVLTHRAINTLDAMVGHRSPRYARFGWASAKLDDVAAWVPARLTAALVAACRPTRAKAVAWAVFRQAPAHPSPNAGVAEAAFAAALEVRLGGINRYGERSENRPVLGTGGPPVTGDIRRATRLSRDVAALSATLLVASLVRAVRRP